MYLKVLEKTNYISKIKNVYFSTRNNNFCFSQLTSMLQHYKVQLAWQSLKCSVIFLMNNNNIHCAFILHQGLC